MCRFLIRNRAALLWFVREAPGYGIAALFAKCAVIFGKRAAFSRQKVPQSNLAHCGAAIKVRQNSAHWHGHQSAALLVGEKRRTCRHVFKCRRSTFVAFFLTYAVFECMCALIRSKSSHVNTAWSWVSLVV